MRHETTFILTWSSPAFFKSILNLARDTKLEKFCLQSQVEKFVTKFTVPLLFRYHIWEAELGIFNVSLLNCTPRCRQQFSHGAGLLHELLHSVQCQHLCDWNPLLSLSETLGAGAHNLTLFSNQDEGESHKGKL